MRGSRVLFTPDTDLEQDLGQFLLCIMPHLANTSESISIRDKVSQEWHLITQETLGHECASTR